MVLLVTAIGVELLWFAVCGARLPAVPRDLSRGGRRAGQTPAASHLLPTRNGAAARPRLESPLPRGEAALIVRDARLA
jgi:hypothetical protein